MVVEACRGILLPLCILLLCNTCTMLFGVSELWFSPLKTLFAEVEEWAS